MNQNKAPYTPGPWKFEDATGRVYDADGQRLIMDAAMEQDEISDEEAAANARLIAAAPELLEALQVLTMDRDIVAFLIAHEPKALAQACRAIGKTTGGAA